MSFYDVIGGHNILSGDLNQVVDALNGTVAGQIDLLAASNAITPILAVLPSQPVSTLPIVQGIVTGDAQARASLALRSDGYGALLLGPGGSTAPQNFHGISGGIQTDGNLTVAGSLTVTGGVSGSSLTTGGTVQGWSQNAWTSPAGQGHQLWTGTGTPGSPAEGDVWIKA